MKPTLRFKVSLLVFFLFFLLNKKPTDLFILAEFFQTLAELFNIIVFFAKEKKREVQNKNVGYIIL